MWIIGKLNQQNQIEFSASPQIHKTHHAGLHELCRLATKFPHNTFYLFGANRVAKAVIQPAVVSHIDVQRI